MGYSIKYYLTEEDYSQYYMYTSWSAPWLRKTRLMYFFRYFLFYFPLSIIFIFGTSKKLGKLEIFIWAVIAFLISLTISSIFYFIIKNKVIRGAKKLIDERESKEKLTAYEVIVNNEEIMVITKKGSNNFKWESVIRVSEKNNLFFIYTNQPSAIIIPKKAFVANNADEFRNFLNKNSIPLL